MLDKNCNCVYELDVLLVFTTRNLKYCVHPNRGGMQMKQCRYHFFPILFLLLSIFLITGCTPATNEATEEYRVVTQIDVVYHKAPIVSEGSFRDPEKMQKILYYLRKISPYGTPTEDPNQVLGSNFYITLRYSDHTEKTYHQRDDRFMRVDGGPWKRIDPKYAVMLSRILGTLQSDTDATEVPFLMPTE